MNKLKEKFKQYKKKKIEENIGINMISIICQIILWMILILFMDDVKTVTSFLSRIVECGFIISMPYIFKKISIYTTKLLGGKNYKFEFELLEEELIEMFDKANLDNENLDNEKANEKTQFDNTNSYNEKTNEKPQFGNVNDRQDDINHLKDYKEILGGALSNYVGPAPEFKKDNKLSKK